MNDPSTPPGSAAPLGGGDSAPGESVEPQIAELLSEVSSLDDPQAKLLLPLPASAVDKLVRSVLGPAPDAKPPAPILPLPRRSAWPRRLAFAAAGALAVAACAAVFLFPSGRPPERTAYLLEIRGDSAQRGDEPVPHAEPVKLRPTTRLRAHLAPSTPVRDKLLRVLVVRGGKATLLDHVPYTITAGGAVAIDAPAGDALGPQENGPAELVFVVGRQVPGDAEVRRLAEDAARTPDGDCDVLRRAVLFEGWGKTGALDRRGVDFAGCESVVLGPVCEVAPGSRIRLRSPARDVRVTVDGQDVFLAPEPIQGGARLAVEPPAGATEIQLRGPTGEVAFRLALAPALDAPLLREAKRLAKEGKLAESEEALRRAEEGGTPAVLLQVLRQRARNARRAGDRARTRELLRTAIAADHAAGRLSDEIDDRHMEIVGAITDLDLAGAAERLLEVSPLEQRCPDRRAAGDYYRSFLAAETGRIGDALASVRRMARDAEGLGLPEERLGAKVQLADLLGTLGRRAEAKALVEATLREAESVADPCEQAKILTGAAWVLWREPRGQSKSNTLLESALGAVKVARERCPSALPIALLNQAFAELSAGRHAAAGALRAEAESMAPPEDRRFASWNEVLAMDIELHESPARALDRARALRARGEASLSPELSFLAEMSRARALDALDRVEDARAAFASAEAALDRWSALVPLGEGKDSFFTRQEELGRLAVDFHVRLAERAPEGPARERAVRHAADIARRSSARFFVTLARAGRVPVEQLAGYRRSRGAADRALARTGALSGHERNSLNTEQQAALDRSGAPVPLGDAARGAWLSLLYHPIKDGWVGFAVDEESAAMARLGPIDEAALGAAGADAARRLLAPFSEAIGRASRVRVPAHGPMRLVPFEALPWGSGTLADAVTVSYGFDAPGPRTGDETTGCAEGPRALLVTDPRGDLASADASAPEVHRALAAKGYRVTWLRGEAAAREVVVGALADPCTAVFHHDGHARFAGVDGLRASLDLARGELTVEDVRALPRVPRAVVLLGCATAKDEGLGLAQAFLEAGAEEVLASTEEVDDSLAADVARRLYGAAAGAKDGPPRLADALRAATLPLREGPPPRSPWWLLRVLSR